MTKEHPVIEAMARKCCCPSGCQRRDTDCPSLTEDILSAKAAAKVLLKWQRDWAGVTDECHAGEIERFAKHIGIELEGEDG